MSKEKQTEDIHLFEGWDFSNTNYIIFGIGLLSIILGYVIMAQGEVNSVQSLSIAPVMLFVGYIVLIPLSLIYRDKSKKNQSASQD